LTLLTTVISAPESGLIIADCGLKSLSNDEGAMPEPKSFAAESIELHEEHALIRTNKREQIGVGDKIELIVGHACTTINLHDRLYLIRNKKLETVLEIKARGKCQ
jgi:D-serine deaminase-like pyridoxal phosphate-dependent protein